MLIGNRIIRNMFLIFGAILIVLNLYYFLWYEETRNVVDYASDLNFHTNTYFHGTHWFFEKIQNFPGLNRMFTFIDDAVNGKFIDFSDNKNIFDSIVTMLKVIVTPFLIIGTFFWSIIENLIWIGSFFLDFFPTA